MIQFLSMLIKIGFFNYMYEKKIIKRDKTHPNLSTLKVYPMRHMKKVLMEETKLILMISMSQWLVSWFNYLIMYMENTLLKEIKSIWMIFIL